MKKVDPKEKPFAIGDVCYLVMNKAKGYVYPFTIQSITEKGYYHVVSESNGLHHNVSASRLYRSKEAALDSLENCILPDAVPDKNSKAEQIENETDMIAPSGDKEPGMADKEPPESPWPMMVGM